MSRDTEPRQETMPPALELRQHLDDIVGELNLATRDPADIGSTDTWMHHHLYGCGPHPKIVIEKNPKNAGDNVFTITDVIPALRVGHPTIKRDSETGELTRVEETREPHEFIERYTFTNKGGVECHDVITGEMKVLDETEITRLIDRFRPRPQPPAKPNKLRRAIGSIFHALGDMASREYRPNSD